MLLLLICNELALDAIWEGATKQPCNGGGLRAVGIR